MSSASDTGYKGVSEPRPGEFVARVYVDADGSGKKKIRHLGSYKSAVEAALGIAMYEAGGGKILKARPEFHLPRGEAKVRAALPLPLLYFSSAP